MMMSEARILATLQMVNGWKSGEHREVCPECGCDAPLMVQLDGSDWSLNPVTVQCPWGHTWAAAAMESWVGANIVATALAKARAICDGE